MQKKNEILEDFNSENSERHILAKPPKEAYFYFPKPDEIVIHDPQNPTKTLRRLFEGNVGTESVSKLYKGVADGLK